ncbi:hypothetical protein POUND7_019972 [Theobroma cacao]
MTSLSPPVHHQRPRGGNESPLDLDVRCLICRFLGSPFGTSSNHDELQLRRKPARMERQPSFSREIGHAAAETYLVTRLSFTLLRYLGYYTCIRIRFYLRISIFLIV